MALRTLVLVGFAGLAAAAEPVTIAGRALIQSGCASGGSPDYFFFEGGIVISTCDGGCSDVLVVGLGRWHVKGDRVTVSMERTWFGKGQGEPLQGDGANGPTRYSTYVAREAPSSLSETFALSTFGPGPQGCDVVQQHNRKADPHQFLRAFEGQHPETSERLLSPAELAGRSPEELRLMRNEIYARYGLAFVSPELQAHFSSQPGYAARLTNVDAFLSAIEKGNVARVAAAEGRQRSAPKR